MKSCFLNRSPFETALILMLAVVVPFLICMIIAYCYYAIAPSYCMKCDITCKKSLCMNRDVYYEKSPPKYPFIASVLEDTYIDEVMYKRYLCSAAIISYSWVVTGSNCLNFKTNDTEDYYGLFVRVASNYWSQGGSLHQVNKVTFPENSSKLIAIMVDRVFPGVVTPVPIATKKFYEGNKPILLYTWVGSLGLPFHARKKYGEVESVEMLPQRCALKTDTKTNVFCGRHMPQEDDICSNLRGGILMEENHLLAVQLFDLCNIRTQSPPIHVFLYLSDYVEWLQNLI